VDLRDEAAMETYLRAAAPDALVHLAIQSEDTGIENESWVVNVEWPEMLARLTHKLGIKFLFTSSVMVFSDNAKGPFTVDSLPDAAADYGYEKLQAELKAAAVNPEMTRVRLGWQIGKDCQSDNMFAFLENQMREYGKVVASTKWFPACSCLEDTAEALFRILGLKPGLYLLDSNRSWTFHEIVIALKELHHSDWVVEPNEDFVFEQRMLDDKYTMPSLKARLPFLR
jgi:dTDP-4-dehydrorhamnose reductase